MQPIWCFRRQGELFFIKACREQLYMEGLFKGPSVSWQPPVKQQQCHAAEVSVGCTLINLLWNIINLFIRPNVTERTTVATVVTLLKARYKEILESLMLHWTRNDCLQSKQVRSKVENSYKSSKWPIACLYINIFDLNTYIRLKEVVYVNDYHSPTLFSFLITFCYFVKFS